MKEKFRFIPIGFLLATLLIYGGISCGTVCDDAAEICGVTQGDTEDAAGDCEGAAECTAQCIVDNDSCDVSDPDLADCITSCAGG